MNHQDTNLMMVQDFLLYTNEVKINQKKSISLNREKIGMISNNGIFLRDRKTAKILFQDKDVTKGKIEMNDRFIVYTKDKNTIFIMDNKKNELIYELKCSWYKFFSLYENRIGFIKETKTFSYIISVFNIDSLETEFEFSIQKTDNKNECRKKGWYFLLKEPRVKIWGDFLCVSVGRNICYFYSIPKKQLLQKFEINEKIIELGMNSSFIILIGEWQDPTRIHIFNYKTGENFKFWSYLDHSQYDTKFDISEDFFFLTCFRGILYETDWMEIYDLHTKGIYKQKLGKNHTKVFDIAVYKNEILVFTTENRLKLFRIDRTPKKEAIQAIYQKRFGKIGENYDIRRHILEYLIHPIVKREGETLRKENYFILHSKRHEIPRIDIFYKEKKDS